MTTTTITKTLPSGTKIVVTLVDGQALVHVNGAVKITTTTAWRATSGQWSLGTPGGLALALTPSEAEAHNRAFAAHLADIAAEARRVEAARPKTRDDLEAAEYNLRSDDFPGSRRYLAHMAAERALAAYDLAHPEETTARCEAAAKAAKERQEIAMARELEITVEAYRAILAAPAKAQEAVSYVCAKCGDAVSRAFWCAGYKCAKCVVGTPELSPQRYASEPSEWMRGYEASETAHGVRYETARLAGLSPAIECPESVRALVSACRLSSTYAIINGLL